MVTIAERPCLFLLPPCSIMLDALNISERRDIVRSAVMTGQTGATGLTITVRRDPSLPDARRTALPVPSPAVPPHSPTHQLAPRIPVRLTPRAQTDDVIKNISRPVTIVASPMYARDPATGAPEGVTSCLFFTFRWDVILSNILGQHSSLEVVLASSAENFNFTLVGSPVPVDTSSFTFRLNGLGANVTNVGWGDHHTRSSVAERYKKQMVMSVGFTNFTLTVSTQGVFAG